MDKVIVPLFYFSRVRRSDRAEIIRRMAVIPQDRQQEVANEYSRIYNTVRQESGVWDARSAANEYLSSVANPYRDELKKLRSA